MTWNLLKLPLIVAMDFSAFGFDVARLKFGDGDAFFRDQWVLVLFAVVLFVSGVRALYRLSVKEKS